jgi:ankyrin repeat protein
MSKKITKTRIESFVKAVRKSKYDDVRQYFYDGGEANILFDSDKLTPLLDAVNGYDIEMIRLLIDNGADVNFLNKFGYSPLMAASWRGRTEIMQILIDNKSNILYTTPEGHDALYYTISYSDKIEAVRLLVENGSDINLVNDYGSSHLLVCAFVGGDFGIESAKLLIAYGANITSNLKTSEDWLTIAEKRRNTSFIDFIKSLSMLLDNSP